ncbi:MAG: hypothetical protein ABR579_07180 [Actinomycetota bacterium]
MKIKSFTAVVLTLALAGAVMVPAAAAGPSSGVSSKYDCDSVVVAIPIPLSTAKDYVPASFQVYEEAPNVTLLALEVARCQASLGGSPRFNDTISAAMIPVAGPDHGGSTSSYYALFDGTSSRKTYRALQRIGGAGDLITDSVATFSTRGGAANTMDANVPWSSSPFTISGAADNDLCTCDATLILWVAGSKGYVRETLKTHYAASQGGAAAVTFQPGTTLAKIAGNDKVTGAAFYEKVHATISFELMNP